MPTYSVVTRFEAQIDGYLAGVTKMEGAVKKLAAETNGSAAKQRAAIDKVATAAGVTGAAIGAVVVGAVKAYADFEQKMSKVAAVTNATSVEQDKLAKAALEAGKSTVFSATEAADAQAELAKAGVTVSEIMGGALKGSLDLAAAGGLDLAKSAEIAAQAMNIFDKSGQDVGHIADVLTAGANKSAAGVDDLGLALSQGGLVAKQTGLTLEDTVGVLSAFADNALKGSDAGTSLKTMLQRLNPQSDEAAALMDQLGLRAYDAQGNFVGLEKYAGMLQAALSGMSAEQRNAALQTLFGSDAVRGANVLYEQGAKGIREYVGAVNDQGAAQRMAARQTDNLRGDLEQLGGALETAFIQSGEGVAGPLRGMVQDITAVVDAFASLPAGLQSGILGLAGITSGALLLAAGATKAVTTVTELRGSVSKVSEAFNSSTIASSRYGSKLGTVASAASRAGIALAAIAAAGQVAQAFEDQAAGANEATKSLEAYITQGKDARGVTDIMRDGFGSLDQQVSILGTEGLGTLGKGLDNFASGFGLFGKSLSDTSKDFFAELDSGLAGLASSGRAQEAADTFQRIADAAKRQGVSIEAVRDQLPQYQNVLDTTSVAAKSAAAANAGFSENLDKVKSAAADAKQGVDDYVKLLIDSGLVVLSRRDAERQLRNTLAEVDGQLERNGRTLNEKTKQGRDNAAFLDDFAKKHLDLSQAIYDETGSEEKFRASQKKSRDELIKTYLRFDNNEKRAKAYADSIIKIPAAKNSTVTFRTVNLAALKTAQDYLRNINSKRVTLTVGTVRVGNTKVNAGQFADGGPVIGPGTGTSDSIDAKLSNGEHVWTADEVQKAGGQGAMYRARAAVKSGALRFATGGAVGPARFADGGAVDWSAIQELLGDVTTYDDVKDSRTNRASKLATYRSAKASLYSLEAQLRRANAAVRAARRTRGSSDDRKALDAQRVLIARVAAAEDRLAVARTKSLDSAKALRAVEKEYAADRRPLIQRTITAATATNKVSATFLRNIEQLSKMGLQPLAVQLLNQGGPEAEKLAAEAVKSVKYGRALQAQLQTSSNLSTQADALAKKLSPVIDTQIKAGSSSNTVTKKFLDNIDRLVKMGFRTLALELLNDGSADAEEIAAQAVASSAKAKALQANLVASSSLQNRADKLKDQLGGVTTKPDLFSEIPQLSWYRQMRDVSGRASSANVGSYVAPTAPVINIDGALDPISVGRQVERVLREYTAVTGQPVRISVAR